MLKNLTAHHRGSNPKFSDADERALEEMVGAAKQEVLPLLREIDVGIKQNPGYWHFSLFRESWCQARRRQQ